MAFLFSPSFTGRIVRQTKKIPSPVQAGGGIFDFLTQHKAADTFAADKLTANKHMTAEPDHTG